MNAYRFVLRLEGPNILTEDAMDRLWQAGCDDATFGADGAHQHAAFSRQASSLGEAIHAAVDAVERAVPGLRVVAVTDIEHAPLHLAG